MLAISGVTLLISVMMISHRLSCYERNVVTITKAVLVNECRLCSQI